MKEYKNKFDNFSKFNLVVVGSFEEKDLENYLKKYIASLPRQEDNSNVKPLNLNVPKNIIKKDVIKKIKMIIINDRIVVQQTNTKMLLIFITSKKISSRSRRLKYPQRTINAIPDIILDGVNTETISVFHF